MVTVSRFICERSKIAHPCLFRSTNRGATARTYVHVHIRRRMTSRSDWKLKSADYRMVKSNELPLGIVMWFEIHAICPGERGCGGERLATWRGNRYRSVWRRLTLSRWRCQQPAKPFSFQQVYRSKLHSRVPQ